jgi:EAL domain-containing protein (putative c-di-GMP-specific phosphodiesterase class I)
MAGLGTLDLTIKPSLALGLLLKIARRKTTIEAVEREACARAIEKLGHSLGQGLLASRFAREIRARGREVER